MSGVAEAEHVHNAACLEQPCPTLYAPSERRPATRNRRPAAAAAGAVLASSLVLGAWALDGADVDTADSGPVSTVTVPAPDLTGLTSDEAARAARVTGVGLFEQADPASGDDGIDPTDVVRYQVPGPGDPVVATGDPVRVFYGPPPSR